MEKIIEIKVIALNINLIKDFYFELNKFCSEYINPFLIKEIKITVKE